MSSGQLFIVATPIGNLADITLRAIDILKQVDIVAAEDTRHSRMLLTHHGISTRLISLYGDNEKVKTASIIKMLEDGQSIALVSDAGTPLISDPGEYLVQAVRARGFQVTPIPGACALIAALSVSGLSTRPFYFEGFLPHKGKMRGERLRALSGMSATVVFYESRHRILDFLALASEYFGISRRAAIARELTKQFETVISGTLSELQQAILADANQQRGEFVVLIEGVKIEQTQSELDTQQMLRVLMQHLPTKQAAKIASEITGQSQRDLYQQLLGIKEEKH